MGLTDLIREKIFSSMIHGEFPFNKFGFPNIYDEDDVREKQEILFQRLLKRLDEVGILRKFYGITRYKHLSLDDLVDIPTIGKKELSQFPVTRPSLNLPPFNKTIEVHTSGTTGKPVSVKWGLVAMPIPTIAYLYFTMRFLGVNTDSVIVNSSMAGYSAEKGTITGLRMMGFKNAFSLPVDYIKNEDVFLRKLFSYGHIDLLSTYPGIVEALYYLGERKFNDPLYIFNRLGIKAIVVGGTGFYFNFNKIKNKICSNGIIVRDIYTLTECGTATFICKEGHKHVVPFIYIVRRKSGEIAITTLYPFSGGTQYINYLAGDIASVKEGSCNIKLPIISDIRRRDFLSNFLSVEDVVNAISSLPNYPYEVSLPAIIRIHGREITIVVNKGENFNKNSLFRYQEGIINNLCNARKLTEDFIVRGIYKVKVKFESLSDPNLKRKLAWVTFE